MDGVRRLLSASGAGPRGAGRLVLVVALLATATSAFVASMTGRDWIRLTLSVSAITVLLLVALRSPAAERRKWWLLAAASFFFILGDIVWTIFRQAEHSYPSLHTLADVFYIAAYPFLFLALRSIFSMRGGVDTTVDLIDSSLIMVSVFAMMWPPLIGPYLQGSSASWIRVVVNLAPPLMDLALIFLAVRYIVLRRSTNPSRALVLVAIVVMTISDFATSWLWLHHRMADLRYASAGDVIKYVLFAAAAVRSHGGGTHGGEPHGHGAHGGDVSLPLSEPTLSHRPFRILILVASGLVPELVYLVAVAAHATINGAVMAVLSCLTLSLVGLRMTEITRRLRHDSLHDRLTQLANRTHLEIRLAETYLDIERDGSFAALVMIDLDDFKAVNDSCGHATGDRLLVTVGERLSRQLRPGDSLYRIGGDVFAYLAPRSGTTDQVEVLTRRLMRSFADPFVIDGVSIDQRASIGSYLWDDHFVRPGEALVRADLALFEAKKTLTGGNFVFTTRLKIAALDRFALVQDLHHARASGELAMHFQPIVDLRHDRLVGFEALMRWSHPSRGMVPPDVFIPLAEQSSLINELGDFALDESIRIASAWPASQGHASEEHRRAPFVSINLSSNQFRDPGLIDVIGRRLSRHGLDPSRLVLEITEGVALHDVQQTRQLLESLRGIGVRVALDDFGTGYSSLSVLAELKPSIVKVDQSFIRPAVESSENDAVLKSIVALCRHLDMVVLAEGVETSSKRETLRTLECDLGQGYLWSPAMPGEDVSTYLAGFESERVARSR